MKKALEEGTETKKQGGYSGPFQPFIVKFMDKKNASFYNKQDI